ncbi:unnamed protein product, partial [Miscanthus lutarioriparius]
MAPTKHRFPMLLLLLLCSYPAEAAAMINSTKAPCLPAQASSLLQLKGSFIVANARLSSWQAGTDCCHWEGIICNTGSGRVISLDLGGFNLMSHRLHPALFNLTSLRNLNLAFNDFTGVRFPASGFERPTDITPELLPTYFIGQIPSGISRLKNLVALDFSDNNGLYLKDSSFQTFMANMSNLRELHLDWVDLSSTGSTWSAVLGHAVPQLRILSLSQCGLSGSIDPSFSRLGELTTINFGSNYELYFQEPNFRTFMANMSNLRELRLDSVDLSSSGSTWSTALADSVPQLQILSLHACGISGSIHPSFSRLRSLASINFRDNEFSGKVPEYFSELSSLSSLDISGNHFEGQFPTEIFQLKSLMMLDLHANPMLFVRFTYFPAGNRLQYLDLAGTNFTYDTPLSFANLTSLQTLSLTTGTMPKELPTSIRFPSLNGLELEGSGLEKPVLSWVGNLKDLKYLSLDGYDFSQSTLSWINNLTRLETFFNFSGPIPYQIGNLANLRELSIEFCDFSGYQIPSWIGNLTKLISLDISDNNCLSGPIPSTIGNLIQIKWLRLSRNNLTGNIPESLLALPALQYLNLDTNQLSGSLEDFTHPLYSGFSQIKEIDLSDNQLTGQIPESLFQLANLQILYLDSNKLMGTIKLISIWGLTNLNELDLSNNMISLIDTEGDTIAPYLPSIEYLNFASCNLRELPDALRYIDTITDLDLSNNQIKGAIPSWVWENWKDQLNTLDLSHNLFTTLEKSPSLVHMTNLAFLDLSSNRLEGTIPIPVTGSEVNVVVLDYSNNSFSSIVSNFGRYLMNAIYINLSKNKLSGHIPASVCSLNKLDIMDLSYNYFDGPVPSCLVERGNLTVLKLRENRLHGVLPKNIGEGCKLQTIDLNGNRIE